MFRGSIVSLITPFTPALQVDYVALRELVEWHVQEGSDGIVVCASTGESPTLTHEEQIHIIKTAVEAADDKVPIIAGTGTYDTRRTVVMTKEAQECGVDGCLVVVPYYNRPTPEGCLRHFQEVAKVGLPMIVYHHPGRTGVRLNAKTLAQISHIPQVVGIKETSTDLDLFLEIQKLTSTPILSGDDTLTLPMMSIGGAGVISIVANLIPAAWKEMVATYAKGDAPKALSIFQNYYNLARAMVLETNPQCAKYAMCLIGKCHPYLRLPMLEPQEGTKKLIEIAVSEAGLKISPRTKDSLCETRT